MFRKQFEGELVLTPLPDGRRWKLHQAFEYETDAGLLVSIPEGFITDLASVPRILWNVYPPFGKYIKSCCLHDFLYSQHRDGTKEYSRAYCDAVLLEAMKDEEVPRFTRCVIWTFVRLGGWVAWRTSKPVS
jgi:hypothetical protein